jgi:hypothetical protein
VTKTIKEDSKFKGNNQGKGREDSSIGKGSNIRDKIIKCIKNKGGI